jgi:hypothetical protein
MKAELARTELQRLIRRTPFSPFFLTLMGGERALIEHPENVAFDPRPGSPTDFYVITGGLRMVSSFEELSSLTALVDVGENGQSHMNQPTA